MGCCQQGHAARRNRAIGKSEQNAPQNPMNMTSLRNTVAGTVCHSNGVGMGRVLPGSGRHSIRSHRPDRFLMKKKMVSSSLRVGSVNVGTLNTRAGEVVETLSRRKVDICCLQEVRWRGMNNDQALPITGKDSEYKVFWCGNPDGTGGVAVLLAMHWADKVISVQRINSRIISLKILIGTCTMTVISAYAPQQGLSSDEKDSFYEALTQLTANIDSKEIILLGADLNGHVGKSATTSYDKGHGGFGYGERNPEGERILEFCSALDMVIGNTLFKKRDSHLITFSSGGARTQIDYILVNSRHRKLIQNVKVIPREQAFTQHKLLVCDLALQQPKTKKKPFHPKIKVWRLKDPLIKEEFTRKCSERLQQEPQKEGIEDTWGRLKKSLISAAEDSCGKTKRPVQRRANWWWDETVDKAIQEKRSRYKLSKAGECSEELYRQSKRAAKSAVYHAQQRAATSRFGNLSTKDSRNNAFKTAKLIIADNKDIIGDPCIKNDAGCKVFSDSEKLKAWKEHYEKLLNVEFPWNADHLVWEPPIPGNAPEITEKSVTTALSGMSDGKAAGCSGVVAEMIKASGEAGISLITQLFNTIIAEKKIPSGT